ncbi:hypothetical protein CEXT_152951 [Caerostris extrusa]|uniref:Uncharacterized protein n=1 Tax=Caerostris extrusa TaxID=172846 RepID=A0AAV4NP29_CAEEX|nr:hypothetical protein CEXT_152951 [Caerostris extrusa]
MGEKRSPNSFGSIPIHSCVAILRKPAIRLPSAELLFSLPRFCTIYSLQNVVFKTYARLYDATRSHREPERGTCVAQKLDPR